MSEEDGENYLFRKLPWNQLEVWTREKIAENWDGRNDLNGISFELQIERGCVLILRQKIDPETGRSSVRVMAQLDYHSESYQKDIILIGLHLSALKAPPEAEERMAIFAEANKRNGNLLLRIAQ